MRRRTVISTLLLCLTLMSPLAQAAPAAQPEPPIDPPFSTEGAPPVLPPGTSDPNEVVTVMVQLAAPPALSSGTNVRAQAAELDAAQTQVAGRLEGRGAQVLFRARLTYNGIAVSVPAGQIASLRSVPGVADVHVIAPKAQVEANIPALISSSLTQSTPDGADGTGARIGVIDSGIDYTHADFGGAGTPEAYAANNRTLIEPGSFPTARVVGGYDFAGDNYDSSGQVGSNTPAADPDPLDCQGRGTHIAGVVAGAGVNASGDTFDGPYHPSNSYADFQVAPGVAPRASLYALKVFGCNSGGTTTLTTEAIEWALDPNRDGDVSDHLDAVVLALSTPFGSPDDPDAVAVAQAIEAGMVVVTASGEGDGNFYSVSAFGSATKAIAVGASVGSPQPLHASDETYTDPSCYSSRDLVGRFLADDEGEITNRSDNCTYQVGIASYRKFDEIIDHQQIFDWSTITLAPGEKITLTVDLPDCAAQVDLFRGPVLYSLYGRRYAERLLIARHTSEAEYCAPETAPVYGLPASAARGIQAGNGTLKPDLVAPSINVRSASFGSGSGAVSQSASWVGAAQVAGAVALLRQLHGDWSPARTKTALMNTAAPVLMDDKTPYPPSLAGAGQLDLSRLVSIGLFAGGDAAQDVALSYGAPQVDALWSATRTLRIENTDSTPKSLTLSTTLAADEPGVKLNIPQTSVTVPAGASVDLPVSLTIDPSQLDFSPDAATKLAVPGTDFDRPRFYLAEHSGYIHIRSANGLPVHVPFVVLPRSASNASSQQSLDLPADATTFALNLQNTGARNAPALATPPHAQVALASAFELLASSPSNSNPAANLGFADLRYLGVTSNLASSTTGLPTVLFFGIATHAPWSTPNQVQFRLQIDTNLDNRADYALISMSWPDPQGQPSDLFRFALYALDTDGNPTTYVRDSLWNTLPPFQTSPYVDVAPFNSSVAFAALNVRDFNLPVGQTTINVRLESRAREVGDFTAIVDQLPASGWQSYDIAHPALAPLARRGPFTNRPLFIDATGGTVSGLADPARIAQRNGVQLLVFHHHNPPASQAALVNVRMTTPTIFSPSQGVSRIYVPFASSK